MARLPGVEPGAYRLGGGRSIHLSYKRIYTSIYYTFSPCLSTFFSFEKEKKTKENRSGKVMCPGTISYRAHKLCDQAGLPHRTVHSLRHTNITMQIAAGHARTSTTTDIYNHFLKSSDKTAAEKPEQMFE